MDLQRRRIRQTNSDGSSWDYYVGDENQCCVSLVSRVPCYPASPVTIGGGLSVRVPVVWRSDDLWCDKCLSTDLAVLEGSLSESVEVHAGLLLISGGGATVLCTNLGVDSRVLSVSSPIANVTTVVDRAWLPVAGGCDVLCSDTLPGVKAKPVELGANLLPDERRRVEALLDSFPLGCLHTKNDRERKKE